MRMLSVVQFSGQVEAARIPESLNFSSIFEEVLGQLNEASRQVSGFGKLVSDRLRENAAVQESAQGLDMLLRQTRDCIASPTIVSASSQLKRTFLAGTDTLAVAS